MRSASSPVSGSQVSRQVLRLGHAAEQRPADGGVVAGGDAEPGVAVDDAGRAADHRDVGQEPGHQPGADAPDRGWPTRSASSSR